MVGEAFAGLSALKSAFDLARGLKDIDDATRRNAAVIELQEKLLIGRAVQADLLERMRTLEEKVASFDTWEVEKKRYELTRFGTGFAYSVRPEAQGDEPPHQICANCFARGNKSFLAQVPNNLARQHLGMGTAHRCSECKAEV
jgi:hypothetical protein